jgi:hypothetical protein
MSLTPPALPLPKLKESNQMNNDYINPCIRCNRKDSESPLKLDYRGKFHICCDSISCLMTLKAQGKHRYDSGASTKLQRDLAFRLAQEKGIDLNAFISVELGVEEAVYLSNMALSCLIDALMNRQIKKAA